MALHGPGTEQPDLFFDFRHMITDYTFPPDMQDPTAAGSFLPTAQKPVSRSSASGLHRTSIP